MGVVPTTAGHRMQHDESRLESNESITIIENEHARNADEVLLESLGYKQVRSPLYFVLSLFTVPNYLETNSHIWNSIISIGNET
jgi:hypothetical protein